MFKKFPETLVNLEAAPVPEERWCQFAKQWVENDQTWERHYQVVISLNRLGALALGVLLGYGAYKFLNDGLEALSVLCMLGFAISVTWGILGCDIGISEYPNGFLTLDDFKDISQEAYIDVQKIVDTDPVVQTYVEKVFGQGRNLKWRELTEIVTRHQNTLYVRASAARHENGVRAYTELRAGGGS